jgi:pimeloyl-ACP methyl ester carboxylesterase
VTTLLADIASSAGTSFGARQVFIEVCYLAASALFILGRRDVMTPPKGAQPLQEKIPGCKVVTISGSGHSLMAEAPDATLDALIEFLGERT